MQKCEGAFRARIQRTTEAGCPEVIPGPRRKKKKSAEEDLEELRAAGEKAKNKADKDGEDCPADKAWKAMYNHSLRLQIRVHGKPVPPKVKRARAAPRARRAKVAKTEVPFDRGVFPKPSAKRGPEPIPRASDIKTFAIPRPGHDYG